MSEASTPTTVLLIEDDARIAAEKERLFAANGLSTVLIGDVVTALEIARLHRPHAIVASTKAPPAGAIRLCQALKTSNELVGCPLLVYARRYDPLEAAVFLEAGANDYTAYTVFPREFSARVKRLIQQAAPRRPRVLLVGEILIDSDACAITCRGRPIATTTTEFKILQSLADEPGRVFSRRQIAFMSGADSLDAADRTVDAHIKNIRRKLGVGGKALQTVRGFGYRLGLARSA